ncbi:hypothetical protein Tco_0890762 [Tanacetum coccineum]|uniref:Xylulose kinase-1 n=1 Tax=Tanacetum coccineum TaxID=301880 RepID=A0ABQ5C1D3_9ASTR
MSALKFADSHNMVAFLAKPTKSEEFEQIVDFLNANPIKYALTINPTIYTLCIEQFWAAAKVKTVNGEVQLQALVDGKKVIINETCVRRDLQLEDAEGIECLPNADIFEQLALMGYEKPSQKLTFYKAFFSPKWKFLIYTILQCLIFLDKQVGDMYSHDEIFVTPSHTKKVFGNMKRIRKGFSRVVTPLFPTMMVQAQEEMGEEPIADEAANEKNVPTQSNDSPLVLNLETKKTDQAKEIAGLKKRVKKLEKKRKSKTPGMKRLFKIGRSTQVFSSEDEDVFNGEEVFVAEQSEKVVEEVVSTAATITTEEITLAQALAELRSAKT